jgi:hypothetical protein
MFPISYRRYRFSPTVIQHAVWLYLRFTLSYRNIEELLAQRGLDLSYESVRSWVLKFGPMIARRLRSYDAALRHLGLSCHHERGLDKTIAPRTHIRWRDGASARCSASNHRPRLNAS